MSFKPNGQETTAGLNKSLFGENFHWGVSSSAYQIEGAFDADGKGPSIWDVFSNRKKKIQNGENGNIACDFYHTYEDDLLLLKQMNIRNFRLSFSWSRILPEGTGTVNLNGLDYYNRVIDKCLQLGITPWVTLYHWDLPQALEDKGGWTNREIINWFSEYTKVCVNAFGDRVKHWMVLNEPMVFTGAGYFLGVHAPGKKGLRNFIPAMHHAAMCQSTAAAVIRLLSPDAQIGTTFSCSHIVPRSNKEKDQAASRKVDALLNRLFIEPALGLGYPLDILKSLRGVERIMKQNDEAILPFDFDFIGIQNYTQEVVKHSLFTPLIRATIVPADKRQVPTTVMNWEIKPEAIYEVLKQFGSYENAPRIIVTENGAAFEDQVVNGKVMDLGRLRYIQDHIKQVHRAAKDGVDVQGYFVWTFIDNFEWAEGYYPRFGLVYNDYEHQNRIVKQSGEWYAKFLKERVLVSST